MAILGREPAFEIARTNRTSGRRTTHHPGQVDHRPIKQLHLQVENFLDLKWLIQKALYPLTNQNVVRAPKHTTGVP